MNIDIQLVRITYHSIQLEETVIDIHISSFLDLIHVNYYINASSVVSSFASLPLFSFAICGGMGFNWSIDELELV